jgi:hypothetical protein
VLLVMTTNKLDISTTSTSKPPAAPPPRQTSLVRLIVLLGILVLAIGALVFDYTVAKPGVEAAEKKIQDFVDARNKLGVKDGALVTADDIHKELGMQPTLIDKHDDKQYTVEYFCWWGGVPLINMRRHFISVVYVGPEPRRFSSHHKNEIPPAEALPMSDEQRPKDDQPLPPPTGIDGTPTGAAAAASEGAAQTSEPKKEGAPDTASDKEK